MVAPPRLTLLTVGDAVDRYLASVRKDAVRGVLSPATARSYTRDVTELASLLGPLRVLDDVTGDDVDDALVRYQGSPDARFTDPDRKRGPGRSVATVNRFRQSATRFFSHAARECWVQADPMLWAAPPARVRGGLRVARTALTSAAAQALLETSADTTPPARSRHDQDLALRDRLVVALLLVLGPRVSELAGADVEDLAREPGQTRWRIVGKGGVVRTVALSEPLAATLDEYVTGLRPRLAALRPDDDDAQRALLLTWRGRRVDTQAIRGLLARAVGRMPAPYRRPATPHALRHTTATLLVAQGWDVKVVAELLGHASIATTGVYLDRIEGELAAAIRAHPLTATLDTALTAGAGREPAGPRR
ncbi:integrase family protein [Xylanimonas cellulosilytica DSM 15894]|uniref:Integrase family protein n=1 Tax=Xylanimonas cellulosilytica (strain DSM 15894 / JCM 12276 / CECT 5975 / KCTC 9989 / LMG 20990 / NBRC 107835 / XIL07) TaxID=446471 RepID=D1BSS5_XYLCX|nr:tyrosine-type recombinase/integrase [Xylanimonas cellulosilytica]ACZ30767.1 integrase family protein [Xylanimonas cellulosilytica DSM 15894]